MSRSGAATARKKNQGSAHLGATLRSVLVAPDAGFQAALRSTQRRAKKGTRPAEGFTPYVLSAFGGSAAMVLWLKIAALAGWREGAAAEYRFSFLLASLALGALLGLAAQGTWGVVAPFLLRDGDVTRAAARLVWGASFFPLMFLLLLLLPIDLLITGPAALTEARPADPVAAGWAALSLALAAALAVWSLGLFAKGIGVATGASLRRASLGVAAGVSCLAAIAVGSRFGLVALSGALS